MIAPALEHFASFDGTRLAIHRTGQGRAVVLLHGLFSSSEMNWIKWGHAQRLADAGFEAIMLDFRVHGQSESPTDPARYPPDVLVRDVAALVDHLALDDFDLAGFSLGARTAVAAVAGQVLRPARLVLRGGFRSGSGPAARWPAPPGSERRGQVAGTSSDGARRVAPSPVAPGGADLRC